MVRFKRHNEFEFEQQVFLGGQVSQKHSEYKEFAMMESDEALMLWFLKNFGRIETIEPEKALAEIVEVIGKLEFLSDVSELTQLSMKLGDTREKRSLGNLRDRLRTLQDAKQ
jgi:hypothetical protein